VTPAFASCSSWGIALPMALFLGGSEDKGDVVYSTPDGMFDSGFYVGKKDIIRFGGDVVNYNNEERTVFSVTEFDYIEGRPDGFLETSSQTVAVGMCNNWTDLQGLFSGGKIKKFAIHGKPLTMLTDGYLVSQSELTESDLKLQIAD
jgi:hypothetical protein